MWILCLLFLGDPAPPSAAPREIVDKMQKFYDRTQDLRASFRQTLINPVYGRKQVFDGTVKLKKPGKMRWDYETPEKKLFVSDGKVLWVYEPEDQQAFRQTLSESALPTAVAFLFGQGKLADEFDISLATDQAPLEPGDHLLKLVPKTPSAKYKFIVLDVDAKTFQVKQSVICDTQGNINQVAFSKVELNPHLGDGLFNWSPPAGTKIVKPGQIAK